MTAKLHNKSEIYMHFMMVVIEFIEFFLPMIGDNWASIILSKFSEYTVLPSSIHSPIIFINS